MKIDISYNVKTFFTSDFIFRSESESASFKEVDGKQVIVLHWSCLFLTVLDLFNKISVKSVILKKETVYSISDEWYNYIIVKLIKLDSLLRLQYYLQSSWVKGE